jgi:hypothetical protein
MWTDMTFHALFILWSLCKDCMESGSSSWNENYFVFRLYRESFIWKAEVPDPVSVEESFNVHGQLQK